MDDDRDLAQLIQALTRPGVLPEGGDGLTQVVETPTSVVFLAGDHAFKLKRAVAIGSLDFTSAERRATACRDEVRLNRRLAPDIYIGLAPLWRRASGKVDVGAPVENPPPCDELLVAMQRLPQERMLDALIAGGSVEPVHVERLARLLVAFHARAERGPEIERHGTRESIGRLALRNAEETEPYRGVFVDAAVHARTRARMTGFLETHERLFRGRQREGRICDGHGDLHTHHVAVLPDGRPLVYDCLEYSTAYRCCDVASDVAFLLMDLEFRGRADLAQVFERTYCSLAGDPTLEAMLPFYRTYRALVRAKVASLAATASGASEAVREAQGTIATRLFAIAERFSRGLVPPTLVVCAGLTGVGKTTVAAELRRVAGLEPLETDRIRKQLAGLDPEKPAAAPPGQGIYTQAMTFATYRTLAREASTRLERGESALVVGTFISRGQRETIREVAREARVPLLFVSLEAPEAVVLERIARRPPGLSDGDEAVYRAMLQRRDVHDEFDASERLDLDAAAHTPAELAEKVLERLRRPFEGARR